MTRRLTRPKTTDTCRCEKSTRTYVFVQKLGIFVCRQCSKPSKAYSDAAYEAGIL